MERDMELVRKILLTLARHPHGHAPEKLVIEGYDDEEIGFHVFIMGQGELLDVAVVTAFGAPSPRAVPGSITWKGYEFLDSVRNDTVWKRVKAMVVNKGGGASMEVVTSPATDVAKKLFLEP
jgi:hypothetical protein